MPPRSPPRGFWQRICIQNHPKWYQKCIQKKQITPSKNATNLKGKYEGKIQGNQFLKQKYGKRRNLKMLIFHWFLQYNMHARHLHALSKLKLARARKRHRKQKKIASIGGKKLKKSMKIFQKLTQK